MEWYQSSTDEDGSSSTTDEDVLWKLNPGSDEEDPDGESAVPELGAEAQMEPDQLLLAAAVPRADDGRFAGGYAGEDFMSEAFEVGEVYNILSTNVENLCERPRNLESDGPMLFAKQRMTGVASRLLHAKTKVKSRGEVDRWKNAGGKNGKVILEIPGVHDQKIVRRKGKILRAGLPSVRYDHYCLLDADGNEAGDIMLYQLRGIAQEKPKAAKPAKGAKRSHAAAFVGSGLVLMALVTRYSGGSGNETTPLDDVIPFQCDVIRASPLSFVSPIAQVYFDEHCCASETGPGSSAQTIGPGITAPGSPAQTIELIESDKQPDECDLVSGVAKSLSWSRLPGDNQTMFAHVDTSAARFPTGRTTSST